MENEGYTSRYADSWIGPTYREQIDVPPDGKRLVAELGYHPQRGHRKVKVRLLLNGNAVDEKKLAKESDFALSADLAAYRGSKVTVELRSDSHFVPRNALGIDDSRELSVKLHQINVELV